MFRAGNRSFRIAASLVAVGALAFSSPAAASTINQSAHGKITIPAWGRQAPVISVNMTSAGFSMPSSVHAGFVTFEVSSPDTTYHALQGISVSQGHTLDEVINDFELGLSYDSQQNAQGARNLLTDATLVGGVVTSPYAPLSVTMLLDEGTYYFFDQNDIGLPGTPAPQLHTLNVYGHTDLGGFPGFSSVVGLSMTGDMPMFDAPSTFQADSNVLIYNNSDEIHEAVWRPVKAGTTDDFLNQYYADLDAGRPHAPSPWLGIQHGLQAMSPGRFAVLHLDLPPGLYAMVCLVPDDVTGVSHSHLGMHKVVTLT